MRSPITLVLAAGVLFVSPPVHARAQDVAEVARPISSFGLDVFRHVAAVASDPNVVFSPLSVGLAVALLTEGAERETRAEMASALGTTQERWGSHQAGIRALLDELNADTTAVTRIASSLWVQEGRGLHRDLVRSAERFHLARVESVDLHAPATADVVDGWARDMTEGRIDGIMRTPVPPELALMLLNAVYFRGKWELPFDSSMTRPAPFVRTGGDSIQVPTMVRRGGFGHFEHEGERGLRIPYRGGRYAAYVVVPRSVSVGDLVARLTVASVDGWSASANARPTELYLPRVEHRGTWPLLEALANAGVPRVVGPGAQLGALWAAPQEGPTQVGDATQATFLKIDEEGTEAAAVTAIGLVVASAPPPPVAFRVDAPFLFVLRDESTGGLLFVARIGDPSDEGR